MERADFVHMVHLSEQASADNSDAYRRNVAAFAALGYAWVLGCLVLACAMVWWSSTNLLHGRFRGGLAMMLVAGLSLLWFSLRALWLRIDAPEGTAITAAQAPALFEALERIRRKIKGPPIHRVLLNQEFNAAIQQVPRFGLLGGNTNYLVIGLPLLMALDKARLLAVLSHEYGHLRGDHGRFGAWIYRTRLSWMQLSAQLSGSGGAIEAATNAFLRWYFPRFMAKTFAIARQDEYEADRVAARLVGADTTAAALVEIEVRSAWWADEFWRDHWSTATTHPQPVGPYTHLQTLLRTAPAPTQAAQALRQALKRPSNFDDTHPGLRDRLEALDTAATLPPWSRGSAMQLLGNSAPHWIAYFNRQWCAQNASDWKRHHARMQQAQERATALQARQHQANAAELVELARLQRNLHPHNDVRALYELALQRSPNYPEALRGLIASLPDKEHASQLNLLHELWTCSESDRWWCCNTALDTLDTLHRSSPEYDAAAVNQWRQRKERASEAEERAWEELSDTAYFNLISRHDLNEFELAEVQLDIARYTPVSYAWVVRKNLREFPRRRAYLLFVELPNMADEDRYHLCRTLEQQITLPGPVLALWAGSNPTLQEIERSAFDPVFMRPSP
ncbi:M48 family metallopeptidase [Curvibacter sp. CHRR-16]|uniref:M48 family metalloprotease n=1 Tax=Curvibacter sp. CHRR-16 TaxID=2835872 RepID=UPI001BDA3A54|nr:M48 family metallopeptidase [Curvibacter sp. CHRR-16]MBT0569612.1 M48 family metallopeptidase [Curvibacter sp. CHRR-16]